MRQGGRLLLTTKQAALFLHTTERMVRRLREEGELVHVACGVKWPHTYLYDAYDLDAAFVDWKARHAA